MQKEQFYDLSFEQLPEGTLRMEQRDNGESYIVDAHPLQIIHIARVLEGAKEGPESFRIVTLERRLLKLLDRISEYGNALPLDFYERCAGAFEFGVWLQANVDIATEYCADISPVREIIKKNVEDFKL